MRAEPTWCCEGLLSVHERALWFPVTPGPSLTQLHKADGRWLCWWAQFRFNVAEARSGLPTARTTVMIKNVPNKYTQRMLLDTFDRRFRCVDAPSGCVLHAAGAAGCPAMGWAPTQDLVCRVGGRTHQVWQGGACDGRACMMPARLLTSLIACLMKKHVWWCAGASMTSSICPLTTKTSATWGIAS